MLISELLLDLSRRTRQVPPKDPDALAATVTALVSTMSQALDALSNAGLPPSAESLVRAVLATPPGSADNAKADMIRGVAHYLARFESSVISCGVVPHGTAGPEGAIYARPSLRDTDAR